MNSIKYKLSDLEQAAEDFITAMRNCKLDTPWLMSEVGALPEEIESNKLEYKSFHQIVDTAMKLHRNRYLEDLVKLHSKYERKEKKFKDFNLYAGLLASAVNICYLKDFKKKNGIFNKIAMEVVSQKKKFQGKNIFYMSVLFLGDSFEDEKYKGFYFRLEKNSDPKHIFIGKEYHNGIRIEKLYEIKKYGNISEINKDPYMYYSKEKNNNFKTKDVSSLDFEGQIIRGYNLLYLNLRADRLFEEKFPIKKIYEKLSEK